MDVEIVAEAAPEAPAPAEEPDPTTDPDTGLRIRSAAARRATPPKKKAALRPALVWMGVAATLALAVGAAIVFRQDIVRLAPGSAGAFRSVGLPVDELGLVIGEVKFAPTFQGERPVLSVTGSIRNTRETATTSPSLRISLLDKDGKPLMAKLARPLNAQIPAGAKRYFSIAIADPPAGSEQLEVVFEAPGHDAPAGGPEPLPAVLAAEPPPAQDAHPAPAAPAPDQHG